jgi:hypothetical protein
MVSPYIRLLVAACLFGVLMGTAQHAKYYPYRMFYADHSGTSNLS